MRTRISATPTAPRGSFTGRHMLMVMLGFFGVVIGMNVLLAIVASTSWSGLVVQNSYVASQEFQKKRDALERQQALGWAPSLSYAPGTVRFAISDGAGEPVDLGPIVLQINRPVGTKGDQSVQLERASDGSYTAMLNLDSGVWDARIVVAATALGPFEFHRRFTVETEQP